MEIHKPKPFHNAREFLSEILIIVIGVSIALIAEQIVEALHWHHKIEAVEDLMRAELLGDDLPQAYFRAAIEPCLIARLNALREAAKPGADGARFAALVRDYRPPVRTWDNFAQQIAQQSDVTAHVVPERSTAWANTYFLIPFLREVAEQESEALKRISLSRYASRRLTQTDADQLSDAIDDLSASNHRIVLASKGELAKAAQEIGLTIPASQQTLMIEEGRRVFGACVEKPDWQNSVDEHSQAQSLF